MTLRSTSRQFAIFTLLLGSLAVTAKAQARDAAQDSGTYQLAENADPASPAAEPYGMLESPGSSGNLIVEPAAPPANNGGLQIQGLPGANVPWNIVIMLTALTLIPSVLLCVTPFARLLIVFHFLRQALGLQTTPSNQTLIGLSLILTFFLMQPVGAQIYETAVVPMQAGQITAMDALKVGQAPLRKFMTHYVREKDVALFIDLAKEPRPASTDDLSMRVLLPAYILSELKAGFQIGTVLFLPFLIVDMVVASITTSVGMLQLPPVVISTPLKLLLFLMVDGWHLLIGSLMRSFN
jgi:flagellar biosynthetic protein FliP